MQISSRRRAVLRTFLAGPAGALLASRYGSALAAATPVNIVAGSFSGVWQDGLKAGPIACYRAKNGGNVSLVFGTPTDFAQRIMATRDRPSLDAVIGTDLDVFQNAQLGIVEKLQPARMPNLAGLLPIFKDPYEGWAFGFDGGRDGLAINTNKVKQPPKTWIEFSERVAKGEFGRAVMYPHLTATDGIAITWLLNRELGGSLENPGPAIKRLREMKPYVTKFYSSNAEPGTALTSGEIDIAAWTDGRTFGVQASHQHIQYFQPGPGSPMLTICFMKVKNGAEAAWDYLDCACDPKNQAAWNQFFPGYYMSHKDIVYPPGSREKQDPSSLDKSFRNWILVPWKDLARVRSTWMEAWTREVGA
jgi:putative spermidine/putrescine transport system substrate-binding protein